jgi:nitrate/nitrite transporter NarK
VLGGVGGLVIFLLALIFLSVPNDERARLAARQFSWAAVGRVLGNRDLWLLGLGFLGVYGAGGTLIPLLSTYMGIVYHVPLATGALMAAVLIIIGIPGSLVGGYLADHTPKLKPIIIAPLLLWGLGLVIFPFVSLTGAWIVVLVLGALEPVGFTAWVAAPGHYKDRVFPEDVATAVGLMLTLAAVGGFLVPIGFGQIEASSGFTWSWVILGVASIVIALVAFGAREPLHVSAGVATRQGADTAF